LTNEQMAPKQRLDVAGACIANSPPRDGATVYSDAVKSRESGVHFI
jgi:hypothetical protein